MSSSDNTTALAENKVLILYILNQINSGIIEDGLYKIISSINDVNYFYFKEVLTDLIDSKLVGIFTKDEEESVLKMNSIIECEKCRVDRIEEVYLGNQEEMIHELLVDFDKENYKEKKES